MNILRIIEDEYVITSEYRMAPRGIEIMTINFHPIFRGIVAAALPLPISTQKLLINNCMTHLAKLP